MLLWRACQIINNLYNQPHALVYQGKRFYPLRHTLQNCSLLDIGGGHIIDHHYSSRFATIQFLDNYQDPSMYALGNLLPQQ